MPKSVMKRQEVAHAYFEDMLRLIRTLELDCEGLKEEMIETSTVDYFVRHLRETVQNEENKLLEEK